MSPCCGRRKKTSADPQVVRGPYSADKGQKGQRSLAFWRKKGDEGSEAHKNQAQSNIVAQKGELTSPAITRANKIRDQILSRYAENDLSPAPPPRPTPPT